MPLYEYECDSPRHHTFEVVQKVSEPPVRKCQVCSGKVHRIISRPTLLHNAGMWVFNRDTKDDVLRSRPSSLKSLKKDKF